MSSRRIHLFRHGQTDWNVEGRIQGHLDVPLNAVGRQQAQALHGPLRERELDVILSSDLVRARTTAAIVAETLGVPVFHDEALREAFLGEAQGLTWTEIEARFGNALTDRWHSSQLSDADVCFPGGETPAQVADRAIACIERFLAAHPFRSVGVSTHGGVIRRVLERILPARPEPVHVPNATVFTLHWEAGRWRQG